MRRVFIIFCALYLTACASRVLIPVGDRELLENLEGKAFWLKQSLYVGPFYDDDRYCLMHPRSFDELTYVTTPSGDIILPPPASGIISAGTKVKLEKIEWPTSTAILRRPLYSPRYNTWAYFRVARDRGGVTLEREKSCILLLSNEIRDEKTFQNWLNTILSPRDNNDWFLSLRPEIQKGIEEKKPVIGMTSNELMAALGEPDQLTRSSTLVEGRNVTKETALYGKLIILLEDGKVTGVNRP